MITALTVGTIVARLVAGSAPIVPVQTPTNAALHEDVEVTTPTLTTREFENEVAAELTANDWAVRAIGTVPELVMTEVWYEVDPGKSVTGAPDNGVVVRAAEPLAIVAEFVAALAFQSA